MRTQPSIFPTEQEEEFLSVKEASEWATTRLKKNVTTSNITYLIQYGRVKKHSFEGITKVSKAELAEYYNSYNGTRELSWREQLGGDLNWALSFEQYKESETTKHVHRLHPYKGKFIPQLVEYFLDSHTDDFKKEVYFQEGDIILDPFSGSGTTMVQAAELGMHAIGIDVSPFNCFIGNCKVAKYDLLEVQAETKRITKLLTLKLKESPIPDFDEQLSTVLNEFNNRYFPATEYKYKVKNGEINQDIYGAEKEAEILPAYNNLIGKYKIGLKQDTEETFLDKWYLPHIRSEAQFVLEELKKNKSTDVKKITSLILSRTIRSCRATTHADLATLITPISAIYYCAKHGKICKPLFSILKWWESYSKDTIGRLAYFDKRRTSTFQVCLSGDSRSINIKGEMQKRHPEFSKIIENQKVKGIFSSPPYVGLIDYHEQHAYAYDLFGFQRNDQLEIGPLYRGQGKEARQDYVDGVANVLLNSKKYLSEDFNVFLVSNDKYNLYPAIADKAKMKIVNQFKRPVLNRTEKDKAAYAEIIFHFREKDDSN